MLSKELDTGATIYQVTQGDRLVSNIYCERPFCSLDSKRFLYARQRDGNGGDNTPHWEYLLCDFGSWKEEVVGVGFHQVSISYGNDFYFQRPKSQRELEFVRLDLATGCLEPIWACDKRTGHVGHPTVSPDGRRLAFHYPISFDPQSFGVAVVNLETGEQEIVFEHPHLCNAHLQFHPTDNRTLLVQLNRGCEFTSTGKRLKLAGDEGATLLLLDAVSGKTEALEIGKPHTPRITGHQVWLGQTDKVIATVAPEAPYEGAPNKGSVVSVRSGEACRQLGTGMVLNHIGSTPCGRYFFGDRIARDTIAVGSPITGKTVVIHEGPAEDLGGSPFGQQSHPHAYLTPDFRWMVFNSDQTGRPQVYVVRIPAEVLHGLHGD